jgi:hypothetical protein
VDLAEDSHARVEMLNHVEKKDGIEVAVGKRKWAGEIPREEVDIIETEAARARSGDVKLARVVVASDHALGVKRGLDGVSAVGASHVQHHVRWTQVFYVPVVPGDIDKMFGMDEVGALPRVLDEPDPDRLATAVQRVQSDDE